MKQDNPFSKLGALDQMLYQDALPKPQTSVEEDINKPENQLTPARKTPLPVLSTTKNRPKKKGKKPHDTMTPRYHDTMQPRNHDTVIPYNETAIFEVVRKSVKQIGKEAATHRFTLEEKNLLADIEYTYKRQGIRTSENEITRIAINYFIEDYRQNGEQSILAKILKHLNS